MKNAHSWLCVGYWNQSSCLFLYPDGEVREQVTSWDMEAWWATSRPTGQLFPKKNLYFLGNVCRIRGVRREGGG